MIASDRGDLSSTSDAGIRKGQIQSIYMEKTVMVLLHVCSPLLKPMMIMISMTVLVYRAVVESSSSWHCVYSATDQMCELIVHTIISSGN